MLDHYIYLIKFVGFSAKMAVCVVRDMETMSDDAYCWQN